MKEDHRKIVAAQRREKMQQRLVEAAILVIADKGPFAVIDDVIVEAGVSRGTFYKYFQTMDELLLAAKAMIGRELVGAATADGRLSDDPAEEVARVMLRFFATFRKYSVISQFAAQLGMAGIGRGNIVHDVVPEYLEWGMSTGRFLTMPIDLTIDLVQVGVIPVLPRLREEPDDASALVAVAAMLRMLGVPAEDADRLSRQECAPLEMPEDSLVARGEAIRSEARSPSRRCLFRR